MDSENSTTINGKISAAINNSNDAEKILEAMREVYGNKPVCVECGGQREGRLGFFWLGKVLSGTEETSLSPGTAYYCNMNTEGYVQAWTPRGNGHVFVCDKCLSFKKIRRHLIVFIVGLLIVVADMLFSQNHRGLPTNMKVLN